MYTLELHGMVLIDNEDGETKVVMRSFERQLGGTSGFKTLEAVEARLIELSEDPNSEWENAFAVSTEGVGGLWWRLSHNNRTGGATDLKLGYAKPGYDSVHYVRSDSVLVNEPWDGQMSLQQAEEWAQDAYSSVGGKPGYVALFDPTQRRIVAAWERPHDYKGISVPLTLFAVGEHFN